MRPNWKMNCATIPPGSTPISLVSLLRFMPFFFLPCLPVAGLCTEEGVWGGEGRLFSFRSRCGYGWPWQTHSKQHSCMKNKQRRTDVCGWLHVARRQFALLRKRLPAVPWVAEVHQASSCVDILFLSAIRQSAASLQPLMSSYLQLLMSS